MNLDALITGSQAALLVGVSRQLVRRWEQLGHLTRTDGKYVVGEVLDAERKTRRSPKSHRQAFATV